MYLESGLLSLSTSYRKMCCISLFQKDREGRSENLGGPELPKNLKGKPRKPSPKGPKSPRKSQKNLEKDDLRILEEENLAKVLENLLSEIKKFNDEVEKIRLNDKGKDGKSPTKDFSEKIRAGRVLPPLLRTLQLLLQRPEAKIVVRPKVPGILLETETDEEGQRRLKFGLSPNPRDGRIATRDRLSEDSRARCNILRQFGIMWLAPFCHLFPGRINSLA